MRPLRSAPRRAFTLVELVASSAITVILLMSIASAVVIAGRALPEEGPASRSMLVADVMDQVAADLAFAQTITFADSVTISFTVPDRDNDGDSERITYQWKAGPDGPFSRIYNDTESVLIDALPGFECTLTTRKVGDEPAPTSTTTNESILLDTGSPTGTVTISASTSYAQGFRPVLPADAASWSITRVDIHVRQNPPTLGSLRAQLFLADLTGAPTGAVRSQNLIAETALPAASSWVNTLLPPLTNLSKTQGVSIVLRHSGTGDTSAAVLSTTPGVGAIAGLDAPGARVMSGTVLSLWTPDLTRNLVARVYGTVTTVTTPADTRPSAAYAASIEFVPMEGSAERLRTAVTLVNSPLLP